MNRGKIEGLIYSENKFFHGSMEYENGRIVSLTEGETDSRDIIIPGLIDVHTHGRAGFDFDGSWANEIAAALISYERTGVTTVIPTIASAPFSAMKVDILEIKKAADKGVGAKVGGIHLEGRWLNPKKRGAHSEGLLALPSVSELEGLVELISPLPVYVTVAAELDGGKEFVRRALELGCVVSLGHTNANYDEAKRLYELGISSATHLYNAMTPLHHRDPGVVGASLLDDNVYIELICDGFHIHPDMVKLAVKMKPESKVVLITDSMMGAGCPDGEYTIAGIGVTVKDGHALGEDGQIAGSTLDMHTGLINLRDFTGLPLESVISFATSNPADLIGLDTGRLRVGAPADFIVLDGDDLALRSVNIARV